MRLMLYMEINIFCVAIVLLMYLSTRRTGIKPFEQKLFDGLLLCLLFILVTDSVMVLLDGTHFPGAVLLNYIDNILNYIAAAFLCFLWMLYNDYFIYEDNRILAKRAVLYGIPFAIVTALALMSPQNGCLFSIGPDNVYMRGPLFPVYAVIMLGYLFVSSAMMLHKAKHAKNDAEKKEYLVLASFVVAPIIGGVLQTLIYGISSLWVGTVFSLLFVYIQVQNRQISTDVLTGINNRRQLGRYLPGKMHALDEGKRLYAVMIDIDAFKSINDSFGHAVGDDALINVALILKRTCGGKDAFLARVGGDEFVVLYECRSEAQLDQLIEEIHAGIDAFNQRGKAPYHLSLSMGSAEFNASDSTSPDELISLADKRMYEMKLSHKQQTDGCQVKAKSEK